VTEVTPGLVAFWAGWAFFAYGPQLVLCLLFARWAARRARGDLLNWLAAGFLWSLVPFAGVVAMWWLWRGAEKRRPPDCELPHGGGRPATP